MVLERSWACFKMDTIPKCLLYSIIPSTKEEKHNFKKPRGGENSPQVVPTVSSKGAESLLVLCGITLCGGSQDEALMYPGTRKTHHKALLNIVASSITRVVFFLLLGFLRKRSTCGPMFTHM